MNLTKHRHRKKYEYGYQNEMISKAHNSVLSNNVQKQNVEKEFLVR